MKYGAAVCIECRRLTERRLPARFPHVCSKCLFPVLSVELPQAAQRSQHATNVRRAESSPRD